MHDALLRPLTYVLMLQEIDLNGDGEITQIEFIKVRTHELGDQADVDAGGFLR